MKKKLLALITSLIFITGLFGVMPMTVSAADIAIDISNPAPIGAGFIFDGTKLTLNGAGPYIITGASTTSNIAVDANTDVTVTLQNVNIDVSTILSTSAFEVKTGSVNLNLSGTNTLKSGIAAAGLLVNNGKSVIISGETNDKLTASGGALGGAGIGGNPSFSGGDITIISGTVTANGGSNGAGIGGSSSASGGNITISGGTVTAAGGDYAAGIGGGHMGSGGVIKIADGSNVTALSDGMKPAIDDTDSDIAPTPGTAATILMANFSELQPINTSFEVGTGGTNTFTPEVAYKSIAMTVPEGTYNVFAGGIKQQHATDTYPSLDFAAAVNKLNIFNLVKALTYADVTFNMQGHGTAIEKQTVLSGSLVTKPSDPSAAGYAFGGWYTESACTTPWNFAADKVTANKELFAKWTAATYAITVSYLP
ncbi:MAG TPA: InlB B-repeat-containing protein [Oscillospiraceae bacterium]|nr:InlB B-repeat-containing protein [Oscillospiraceae bacterium]